MINELLARATKGQPNPVIGMGATVLQYSDRTACTIIDIEVVKGGWRVTVQEDHAHVQPGTGGYGAEVYTYEPNPSGRTWVFVWKDGSTSWRQAYRNHKGNWCLYLKGNGLGLRIGERSAYRDPSF